MRRLRPRGAGTRDFFPEEMRVRNWLFAAFRETARKVAPLLGYRPLLRLSLFDIACPRRRACRYMGTAEDY